MKPVIRDIRLSKGLKQNYCAEKVGVSQQLWSQFEKGDKYPRVNTAFKMAEILGVSIYDLYISEEKEK